MTVNNYVMQTQADFTEAKIVRKKEKEITSIGAAIAAGLKVGVWNSLEEVESKIEVERVFESQMSSERREKLMKRWV